MTLETLRSNLTTRYIVLSIMVVVFLVLTSVLGRPVSNHWNSPDEMANAFWAERVAAWEPLAVRDPIFATGAGAVHPRSFTVLQDALVPGSFPGLFLLYGALHGLTRVPLWTLTPFFTALAALALYGALRRRDERWAFWSTLLFLVNPAVIYYASRGLFHNLLVIDLVIFALWFLTTRPLVTRFSRLAGLDDVVAGLVLGGALVTRLAELPWIVFGVLVWIWATYRSPRPFRRLLGLVLGAMLPLVLYGFLMNSVVYGSPWRTGYVLSSAASTIVTATATSVVPQASLLPFGFHPRLALANLWNYALMFWFITLPALIGLGFGIARWKRLTRGEWAESIFAVALTGWVAIFYGSWLIRDRYDPADVTIGTSYVRYFLPALVLTAPFIARFILALTDWIKKPRALPIALLVLISALSLYVVVWRGDESLLAVRRTLATNEAKFKILLPLVPPDAVLFTARFDKLLFPEHLRFVPSFDAGSLGRLGDLAANSRMLYYGLDSDEADLQKLEAAAESHGLMLNKVVSPWAGESLWSFGLKFTPL